MISVKCCIFKSYNTDDKNINSFSVNVGVILLQVRVNSLLCLGKLLEFMDKWYVLDEILPILQNVKSREPAVLMSILGMTLHLVYIHIITFIIYVAMVTLRAVRQYLFPDYVINSLSPVFIYNVYLHVIYSN